MAPSIKAILGLRILCERFADGTLPFDEFQTEFGYAFSGLFDEDDPGVTMKNLPEELQPECRFYLKWVSAAASGFRNPAWVYGDLERNGWVDKQAYQSVLAREFHQLKFSVVLNANGN